MPYSAAYSTSKAGLIGLTKSAAKELAREGIYVNCITPSASETAMAKLLSPERKADILSRIPMGRLAEVDEVARMVAWLVSRRLLVLDRCGVRSFRRAGDLLMARPMTKSRPSSARLPRCLSARPVALVTGGRRGIGRGIALGAGARAASTS